MKRLGSATLEFLTPDVRAYSYDRTVAPRVVHIGVGGFFRSHIASYFDVMNGVGSDVWMISGASLKTRRLVDALAAQDGLFTHVTRSVEGKSIRLIRSVACAVPPAAGYQTLIQQLSDTLVSVVTLTVTEKGYGLNPVTGELDSANLDVLNDLTSPATPKSPLGILIAALDQRFKAGDSPFTVLPCDNVAQNGNKIRKAMMELAGARSAALRSWLNDHGSFPSTMVDRITPTVSAEQIDSLAAQIGVQDQAAIFTEPFSQWVIERRGAGALPPLELAGVRWVDEISVWEKLKLRTLNAAHSAMAYLGGLAGYRYVHEVVSLEVFRWYLRALWRETASDIAISDQELAGYLEALEERFLNTALPHDLYQIATDGSQKLPPRLVSSIVTRLEAGLSVRASNWAVAAWIVWQRGMTETGGVFKVNDPLSERTAQIVKSSDHVRSLARDLLHITDIFGDTAERYPGWASEVSHLVQRLVQAGTVACIDQFLAESQSQSGTMT